VITFRITYEGRKERVKRVQGPYGKWVNGTAIFKMF
jgi:hypothetical protein